MSNVPECAVIYWILHVNTVRNFTLQVPPAFDAENYWQPSYLNLNVTLNDTPTGDLQVGIFFPSFILLVH
jgi:hypothetical protein